MRIFVVFVAPLSEHDSRQSDTAGTYFSLSLGMELLDGAPFLPQSYARWGYYEFVCFRRG